MDDEENPDDLKHLDYFMMHRTQQLQEETKGYEAPFLMCVVLI